MIAHMNARGITAVNGNFIPDVALDPTPSLSEAEAAQTALDAVGKAKSLSRANLVVGATEFAIFRTGHFDRVGETALDASAFQEAQDKSPGPSCSPSDRSPDCFCGRPRERFHRPLPSLRRGRC